MLFGAINVISDDKKKSKVRLHQSEILKIVRSTKNKNAQQVKNAKNVRADLNWL